MTDILTPAEHVIQTVQEQALARVAAMERSAQNLKPATTDTQIAAVAATPIARLLVRVLGAATA